jgi:class 3 adenylate cyclase
LENRSALAVIYKTSHRPWPIRFRLAVSLAAASIIGTAVFSTLSHQVTRRETLEEIDNILCAAAEGAQQIVPQLLINEAEQTQRTEPQYTEAYRRAHDLLERYTEAARLEFVWAIMTRPDGTAYELISNLSPAQQAARADPMDVLLMNPYDLPPVYSEAARTGERRTGSAEDEYGSFRSCILPVTTQKGQVALFGADMEISIINSRLRREMLNDIGTAILVLIGSLLVIGVVTSKVSREMGLVVAETEAVSRFIFLGDEQRRRSMTKEVDQLFNALFDMKNGLRAFSKYVPTSVVAQVLATGKADVGGERRELSLLMTDVTDFTTISEQLEPERVMIVMSEYFDRVVEPILDARGTLDKYVGDAIFAYWNAPAHQENHAWLCCAAALAAREASNQLAREWEDMGRWAWRTRFGLHTGDTVFGNVGAPDRMDFTVIGSSVNLASRIEGLNKFYGTEILASDRLRQLADGKYLFRSIDHVLPKGAMYPFEIFELLGERDVVATDKEMMAYCLKWERAYRLFRERKWAAALVELKSFAFEHPKDKVAMIYVTQCETFLATPPPATWDGIRRFDSK